MSFPKELLSTAFEDRGLDYELILSSEYAALYEVANEGSIIIAYDIFKLDELYPLADNEHGVYYPRDHDFFQEIDTFTMPIHFDDDYNDNGDKVFIKALLKFKELGYE